MKEFLNSYQSLFLSGLLLIGAGVMFLPDRLVLNDRSILKFISNPIVPDSEVLHFSELSEQTVESVLPTLADGAQIRSEVTLREGSVFYLPITMEDGDSSRNQAVHGVPVFFKDQTQTYLVVIGTSSADVPALVEPSLLLPKGVGTLQLVIRKFPSVGSSDLAVRDPSTVSMMLADERISPPFNKEYYFELIIPSKSQQEVELKGLLPVTPYYINSILALLFLSGFLFLTLSVKVFILKFNKKNQRGASLVEFALLVALIALICIASMKKMTNAVQCPLAAAAVAIRNSDGMQYTNIPLFYSDMADFGQASAQLQQCCIRVIETIVGAVNYSYSAGCSGSSSGKMTCYCSYVVE